jgi:hypothetical protein
VISQQQQNVCLRIRNNENLNRRISDAWQSKTNNPQPEALSAAPSAMRERVPRWEEFSDSALER